MTDNDPHPIWNSCRLAYTICAFFCLVFQLCMRNALNFAILCMVKQNQENTTDPEKVCQSKGLEGEFDWTRKQELLLISSFYYGYLVTQPIAGRLCDKFGGKIFFITALVAQSLVFMLIPACARIHFWFSVAVRVVQGVFAGFGTPALYQLYTVWAHPTERTILMSAAYAGFAVGSLIIYPLSCYLCHIGWEYVYYTIGSAAFAFGTACYWLVYSTIDTHPRISESEFEYLTANRMAKARIPPIPWKKIATSCAVLTFIATHFSHSYGLIIIIMSLPKYNSEVLKFDIVSNGFFSTAPFVGALISRTIVVSTFRRLFTKLNLSTTNFRRAVYVTGNSFTILFVLMITTLTPNERIFIIIVTCLIGATIDVSFTGAYWTSYLDVAPAFAGLLTGISNAFSTMSGIVAPLLVSSLVDKGNQDEWNHVFYTVAGFYAFSLVLYGLFGSSKPEPWGQFLQSEENK